MLIKHPALYDRSAGLFLDATAERNILVRMVCQIPCKFPAQFSLLNQLHVCTKRNKTRHYPGPSGDEDQQGKNSHAHSL